MTGTTGLSAGDIMALSRDRDDSFGENWIWIIGLLIIAGIFGGGFGGLFGGNAANQVTNDFLFNNLANQNREIMAGVNATDRDVLTSSCNTQKEILESRYTTQLGFQNTNAQMAQCCCDLKTAIHAEGEETRALITANTIQDLRDRLSLANNTIASQTLATNIVNEVRPFPVPSWNVGSPYQSYYGLGTCSCNNTLI